MNAIKEGCKDITVVDICPFTKEYYELKKAALLTLSLEEFLNFFSYEKKDTSSMKKIEEALSLEESYLFWKSLSTSFPKEKIQKKLFTRDEYPIEVIQKINPYLKDEDSYKKTQEEISSISPTFIEGDILRHPYERQFDAIWLSNIFDYKGNQFSARQIHQFTDNLSDEGLLLLYYLYYTSHQEEPIQIEDLYDPERIIRFFPYDSEFYQFRGIDSYLLKKNHTRDGVIIYQKEKRN